MMENPKDPNQDAKPGDESNDLPGGFDSVHSFDFIPGQSQLHCQYRPQCKYRASRSNYP